MKSMLAVPTVDEVGVHLGVPMEIAKKKGVTFQVFCNEVSKKIMSWANLRLSQVAKLILIHSILLSMTSHVMRSFKIPKGIAQRIDSLLAKFWWAGNGERGIHWVNRDIIHLPKGLGGLGVRSIEAVNDAFLFKQAMRIHKNSQLLVSKVINSRQGCLVCNSRSITTLSQNSSWGKRSLFQAVNKFEEGLAWKIGNGCKVKAISMSWVNGRVPVVKSDQQLVRARDWMVKDFIGANHEWDHCKVRECFEWKEAKEISAMEQPRIDKDDYLYWKFHPSGRFSI
ncbi:hypothetical protein SOVF_201970, partial [Spinacia oleracea]